MLPSFVFPPWPLVILSMYVYEALQTLLDLVRFGVIEKGEPSD